MSPAAPSSARALAGTRLLRALAWGLVVAYFVVGLAYLALRHLVWPNTALWLPQVERTLADAIGRPVRIGPVQAGFEGLRPALDVQELAVLGADGAPAFSVGRIRAALSLSSLATGQLRFARLEIEAPALRIERLAAERFQVGGVALDLAAGPGGSGIDWLFAQRRVALHGVDLEWQDHPTGRTLKLEGADLVFGTRGRRHRLALSVPEVDGLGRRVEAAFELHRPAFARFDQWRRWEGALHLAVAEAELPALADLAAAFGTSPAVAIERGRAAARLWARFDGGEAVDALLKLAVVDAGLALADGPLAVAGLELEAELARGRDNETRLRIRQLSADLGEGLLLRTLPDARQLLRFDAQGVVAGGELAVDRFDAGRLLALVRRLPLPDAALARFAPLRLAGGVERLALSWQADAGRAPTGLPAAHALEAHIDGLSLAWEQPALAAGRLGVPAFRNLSGTVSLNQAGGRLAAAGRKATLIFPGLFAEPEVPLAAVDARVAWRMLPAGPDGEPAVEVDIEHLRFAAVDAAGQVSGRYLSGGKRLGVIDLSGSLERADATRVARYLPLEIPAEVRDWVARSIRGGRSSDVRFVLRGDLLDFPYRKPGSGLFRVEATLRDATLAYAPGWPAIGKIQGRLLFEGAGMNIDVESGQLWGVALGRTRARIAEYDDGLLSIEGAGQGPAQDMLRFLDESPLRDRVGDFGRAIAVDGTARLGLKLEIPLADVDATRVAGTVRFDDNRVRVAAALPPFTGVSGTLAFTEDSLALQGLGGGFVDGSVRVDGEVREAGQLVLRASGRTGAEGLRQLSDNPLTRALAGAADWRGTLTVRGGLPALVLESELAGLSSSLPEPFAKQADERWPLRIETAPAGAAAGTGGSGGTAGPRRDTLSVALRGDVRAFFEREHDPATQTMKPRRGVFALAAEPLLPASGFALRLQASRADVDAWSAVFGAALEDESADPASGLSLLPSEVSLVARQLKLAGKELHEVVVGATRSGGFWRANVHANEVDGFFSWRAALPGQEIGTLTARFDRLEVPKARGDELASLIDSVPRRLPGLDIAAREFVLDGRPLGRLALRAVNAGGAQAPVWRLETLSLAHPSAALRAQGEWRAPRGEARRGMALDFELDIADAGQLLALYGYRDIMRAGAGSLSGRIGWTGSPFSIDYPSAQGRLSLKLGKGEFLKTEPGIAKLIGVLNLQSLRRRLAFDFRDLFAEGFAFDEVSGKVDIAKGIAQTDDFSMRGVTAQVKIEGQADLAAETQDLLVEVRPELNAGLASLAYAALANPAIGLGTFLAQWLLREPLREMFAWQYSVTGSWADPVVETRARPTVELPPGGG